MPRQSRYTKQQVERTPEKIEVDALLRDARKEADKWKDVSETSRLTYEAKARQLDPKLGDGWDMETACKSSRYSMRAAGLYVMRKSLKKQIKTADQIRKKGMTGKELHPVREAQFAMAMKPVGELLRRIQAFDALSWHIVADPKRRLEQSHRKSAAKDSDLALFHEAARSSQFRVPLLVAEVSGCRGEEFREGIRIEAAKKAGVATLRFFIQSAKCDQDKKGLDVRCVESSFPSEAREDVQRRWLELAGLVAAKKVFVVKIEPTACMKAGQRLTNAAKFIAKKAGVDVACYSIRHRFSAQVKEASGGDAVAVALALGHQSTNTQEKYSRASRGGGGISPANVTGVQLPGSKVPRGPATRTGPPLHTKQKMQLSAMVPSSPSSPKPRGPRL